MHAFRDWNRFAREHGGVDRGGAGDDSAVGGDLLAGADDEQVADGELVDSDVGVSLFGAAAPETALSPGGRLHVVKAPSSMNAYRRSGLSLQRYKTKTTTL